MIPEAESKLGVGAYLSHEFKTLFGALEVSGGINSFNSAINQISISKLNHHWVVATAHMNGFNEDAQISGIDCYCHPNPIIDFSTYYCMDNRQIFAHFCIVVKSQLSAREVNIPECGTCCNYRANDGQKVQKVSRDPFMHLLILLVPSFLFSDLLVRHYVLSCFCTSESFAEARS